MKKILKVLTEAETISAANWSRRFKNNLEKLHSGDPFEVAEVLRNLSIRDREKGLSGEKWVIAKARQILISELSHAAGKSEEDAEIHDRRDVLDGAHGVGRWPLRPDCVDPLSALFPFNLSRHSGGVRHAPMTPEGGAIAPSIGLFRGGVSIVTENEQGRGGGDVRGRVAGGVRLIFVALIATVGGRIGEATGTTSTSRALLFVFLGAGVGYVVGGVFGRLHAPGRPRPRDRAGKKPPAVLGRGGGGTRRWVARLPP